MERLTILSYPVTTMRRPFSALRSFSRTNNKALCYSYPILKHVPGLLHLPFRSIHPGRGEVCPPPVKNRNGKRSGDLGIKVFQSGEYRRRRWETKKTKCKLATPRRWGYKQRTQRRSNHRFGAQHAMPLSYRASFPRFLTCSMPYSTLASSDP